MVLMTLRLHRETNPRLHEKLRAGGARGCRRRWRAERPWQPCGGGAAKNTRAALSDEGAFGIVLVVVTTTEVRLKVKIGTARPSVDFLDALALQGFSHELDVFHRHITRKRGPRHCHGK